MKYTGYIIIPTFSSTSLNLNKDFIYSLEIFLIGNLEIPDFQEGFSYFQIHYIGSSPTFNH